MDFIGLEDTIAKCLAIAGVQEESFAGEIKPNVNGNIHLVAILSQGVKAIAVDVTDDSSYKQAYQAYYSGIALVYKVLRVPEEKINDVRKILSQNTKVDVRLPILEKVIEVGGDEPIPEISTEHQRTLTTSNFSLDGRKVIELLYKAEAGICGTKGSWGVLLEQYITGLEGNNPRYKPESIKKMLQLTTVPDAIVSDVLTDMKQYRSRFTD